MVESLNEFWKLVVESELLKPEACRTLSAEFSRQSSDSASAKSLAEWLIARHEITVYHAKALLAGLAGPFFFGDYKVLERLPGGDLTRRLQGVHLPTGHQVILHFWADLDTLADDQWERACAYAARHEALVHPNLDRCYETLTRTKHRIAVTEDVRGKYASDELNSKGRFSIASACDIVRQAALGLDMVHQAGLVHGRVQSTDLCVQSNGHVKLLRHPTIVPQPIDFEATDPKGRILASADYFAPELAGPNRFPDPATDIYALGCVLFELLQGRPPFAGGKLHEKMVRHAREPVPSLAESIGAPRELAEIVARMMAKDYNLRFQQASEVADRLEVYATRRPSSVLPIIQATEAKYLSYVARQQSLAAPDPPKGLSQPVAPPAPLLPSGSDLAAEPKVVAPGSSTFRAARQARRTALWLALGTLIGSLASIGVIALVLSWMIRSTSDDQVQEPSRDPNSATIPTNIDESAPEAHQVTPMRSTSGPANDDSRDKTLSEDDGTSLWLSPTRGSPIDTRYLPSGAQLIGFVNVAQILSSEEGARVLRAMGPRFNEWMTDWLENAGLSLKDIDSILFGCVPDVQPPEVRLIVRLTASALAGKGLVFEKTEGGKQAKPNGQTQVWVPDSDNGRLWVVSHGKATTPIDHDEPSLLRRDLETLVASTDSSRHVTLVSTAHLWTAGVSELFPAAYPTSQAPINELLVDPVQAVSLSLHLIPDFYIELTLVPAADADPHNIAQSIRDRIVDWPTKLSGYLGVVDVDDHWRALAVRFPLMIRSLVDHMRVAAEPQQVICNAVLPAHAAHNLILASQMSLAAGARSALAQPSAGFSIADILAHRTTYSFAQQSLEFALRDLTILVNDDLPAANFSIQILGADLQAEGITRNQQITDFSESATVAQILASLLMRANPVTTVKSPSEAEQKLVWIVGANEDHATPTVLITTRKAAQQKGYTLPDVFRRNGPS
jgi:serine/threonine protein kinase